MTIMEKNHLVYNMKECTSTMRGQKKNKVHVLMANEDKLAKFLNSNVMCMVCFKEPKDNLNLIKHHVSYFPQVICFVHFDCHNKIHHPDNTLPHLIQYGSKDSRKFYESKK